MTASYSINRYDRDGDLVEECIVIHVGDYAMIQFKDIADLESFSKDLIECIKQIKDERK